MENPEYQRMQDYKISTMYSARFKVKSEQVRQAVCSSEGKAAEVGLSKFLEPDDNDNMMKEPQMWDLG